MFLFLFLAQRLRFSFLGDAETKNFSNKIDHNNPNSPTYNQRFHENYDYAPKDGKFNRALVYIGGEGPLEHGSIEYGSYMELAKKLNAAFFGLEHRFFGKSRPYNEYTEENYKYLTIDQAMADLAEFIEKYVQPKGTPDLRIGVIGGSYPGALSSWFRLKYPNMAWSSWASSAPVLIKNDFVEYDEFVGSQLKIYSPKCFENTKKHLQTVADCATNGSQQILIDAFGFLPEQDKVSMCYVITDMVAAMVQYNSNYKMLADYCPKQEEKADWDNFVQTIKDIFKKSEGNAQDSDLLWANSTDPDDKNSQMRSWTWMTCKEVGWFQTASKDEEKRIRPTNIDLNYFKKVCSTLFPSITELADEDEMNRYFGGKNPQQTRVYFLNGDVDPWSSMSVVNASDDRLQRRTILIANESHCSDLYSFSESDTKVLNDAKLSAVDQMEEWLNQEDCNGKCGHGVCRVDRCACDENWGGKYCDVEIVKKTSYDTVIICSISIPVVLVVAVIFGTWIYYYKLKKTSEEYQAI